MLLLLLAACPTEKLDPATCDALEARVDAEADAIRSCTEDAECGQVLTGSSCGCTRDLVARTDADPTAYYAALDALAAAECPTPESTCDCPDVYGRVCDAGTCAWDYAAPALPTCTASEGQPRTIAEATVSGDELAVRFDVAGGCEEHDFTLCWPDPTFTASDPPETTIDIRHDTTDTCEALVNFLVVYDLRPVRVAWQAATGATSGTIRLHLDDRTLDYTF